MSDNILQPDLDALHQSAIAILTQVSKVMEEGSRLMKKHNQLLADENPENPSENRLGAEIEKVERDLESVVKNLEELTSQNSNQMISIKAKLENTDKSLSTFQSCLERQKGILDATLKQIEAYSRLLSIWNNESRIKIISYAAEQADKDNQVIFSEGKTIHTELINEFETKLDLLVDEMGLKISLQEYQEKQVGFGVLTGNTAFNNSKWCSNRQLKECIAKTNKLAIEMTNKMSQRLMITLENHTSGFMHKINNHLKNKLKMEILPIIEQSKKIMNKDFFISEFLEFENIYSSFNIDISLFNINIELSEQKVVNTFHDESVFYGAKNYPIPKDMFKINRAESDLIIFMPFYREASFFDYFSKEKAMDEINLCINLAINRILFKSCASVNQQLSKSINTFVENSSKLLEKTIADASIKIKELLEINNDLMELITSINSSLENIQYQLKYQ